MIKTGYAGKFFILLIFGWIWISPFQALADGFIIPKPRPREIIPPLTVKYHRVKIDIVNQVAKTEVDQVFINNHDRDIEGTYIFPLPEDAAITDFAMYIEGKKVTGEVLDKDRARQVYEEIVRRLKDPALLEYIGRNMFRARVYPIPAKGEKRITLSYNQVLKAEGNLVKYIYPLNTERFSYRPIKEVAISARIESSVPVTNVYSSTHKLAVRKESEGTIRVSYEETEVKPDKDFILYYSLSEDDIGLSLMNWEGEEDNFFMLLASPKFVGKKDKVMNKNLIFVLDSSGSMSGTKIKQAKEAVRFVINHLNDNDRFSILDFDDGVDMFTESLVPAGADRIQEALSFVEDIEDSGGTNINEALLSALKMTEPGPRPNYILFLTDGLPTVGITETTDILKNIDRANGSQTRIFVFGVGYDVNTLLLDRMSLDSRGTSVYVGENDNLEVAVSGYYEKISSPLLSDISVKFSGIRVKDVYPRTLPDLFKGSQLVMIGKYTGDGPVEVVLNGQVEGRNRRFSLTLNTLNHLRDYKFLERIWAIRRIGSLLEEIRLNGVKDELAREIKRLGLKFGIVTPYTSFLVTEGERRELDAAAPAATEALAARQVTGKGAVRLARATQKFKDQDLAVGVSSLMIRYKFDKTFYLKDGFWVDSLYKEGAHLKEIEFGTEAYFGLLSAQPDLGKYLAVAKDLIVVFKGVNYKILEKNSTD